MWVRYAAAAVVAGAVAAGTSMPLVHAQSSKSSGQSSRNGFDWQQILLSACVGPDGQLRVIRASEECRKSETRWSWQAGQGEPGPQGPAGPTGPQGPQGEMGPQGPQGEMGPAGPQGEVGPQGPQGEVGPQGEMGPAGPQGERGADGAPGVAGPMGPQGERGADGAPGVAGPMGPVGPQGLQGERGADGAPGVAGPMGPVGPQGPQGERGADGAPGVAGPMGPQGPQGERGADGAPGVAGPQGERGADGAPGVAGPAGPAGPMGPQGPAGLDGSQGPVGPPGPQGPAGPAGAALRLQHSWLGGFQVSEHFKWTTIPLSETTFTTEGGPLQISIDVSMTTVTNQTFSCRPTIDGQWAGHYGNYAYADIWTEGTMTTYASVWTMWAKSRIYTGVPAGTHTIAIQCLRESMTAAITVGHAIVPGSLSVLEMH